MVKKVKINRNKATVVYGEDYYAPYAVTKVKENFSNLNKAGQMDGDGTFCVYEWAADHSNCLRKTVSYGESAGSLRCRCCSKGKGHAADYGTVERCERQLLLLSR